MLQRVNYSLRHVIIKILYYNEQICVVLYQILEFLLMCDCPSNINFIFVLLFDGNNR